MPKFDNSPKRNKNQKTVFHSTPASEIIRPSKSSWLSPLHLVPKSTPGKWRVCGDFRHLNQLTKPDRYLIPNINSLGSKLFKMFANIDLLQAYYQIPMNKADIEKSVKEKWTYPRKKHACVCLACKSENSRAIVF